MTKKNAKKGAARARQAHIGGKYQAHLQQLGGSPGPTSLFGGLVASSKTARMFAEQAKNSGASPKDALALLDAAALFEDAGKYALKFDVPDQMKILGEVVMKFSLAADAKDAARLWTWLRGSFHDAVSLAISLHTEGRSLPPNSSTGLPGGAVLFRDVKGTLVVGGFSDQAATDQGFVNARVTEASAYLRCPLAVVEWRDKTDVWIGKELVVREASYKETDAIQAAGDLLRGPLGKGTWPPHLRTPGSPMPLGWVRQNAAQSIPSVVEAARIAGDDLGGRVLVAFDVTRQPGVDLAILMREGKGVAPEEAMKKVTSELARHLELGSQETVISFPTAAALLAVLDRLAWGTRGVALVADLRRRFGRRPSENHVHAIAIAGHEYWIGFLQLPAL